MSLFVCVNNGDDKNKNKINNKDYHKDDQNKDNEDNHGKNYCFGIGAIIHKLCEASCMNRCFLRVWQYRYHKIVLLWM